MGGPEVGRHGGMGAQGDKGTKNMGERTDEGHGEGGDTWGTEGTEGHRKNEGVEVLPRLSGAAPQLRVRGSPCPVSAAPLASKSSSPARRPRLLTRACRPLRAAAALREAPSGPRGSRARSGARLTSASCRAAPASRPQPTVQTFGRGVRRPSPRRPLLGPAPQPRSRPLSSRRPARRTGCCCGSGAAAGWAGTEWRGCGPGRGDHRPGSGALTSAPATRSCLSPGLPSRPAQILPEAHMLKVNERVASTPFPSLHSPAGSVVYSQSPPRVDQGEADWLRTLDGGEELREMTNGKSMVGTSKPARKGGEDAIKVRFVVLCSRHTTHSQIFYLIQSRQETKRLGILKFWS